MKNINTTGMTMKFTKTSIALLSGLVMACAGVIAPGAASASPGSTMCLTLGEGLDQDPVTSGHLQVVGVRKLYTKGERRLHHVPMGAAISVLPKPGMTIADLQRAAACHAGNQNAHSPLGVDGVKVRVERHGSTYVIHVTADTRTAALEVQRRAEASMR